eukprot:TRINITY_DN3360_c0_g1_i1.p1 TRINITY_DN3360_c0_g1~~TRINITY_DN3360_c0_g1_i1.p1  ORF type:complete len:361 (-),score=81.13 TRINITY_DN3360_c0_g1_i1:137-1219(-)
MFRFSLLFAVVLFFVVGLATSDSFEEYARQFQKSYISEEERLHREKVFHDNVLYIEKINAMHEGSKEVCGWNHLTDLSREEFVSQFLMPRQAIPEDFELKKRERAAVVDSLGDLPTSFNWVDQGAVTKVRDQGTVGSCWAFSTAQNIEGQWFLKSKNLVELSPEQLVDCDDKDCGVFGGWPYRAFEYLMESGGIQSESDYPYCSGLGKCYPCMANKNQTFCGPPPEYCNRTCLFDSSKFAVHVASWTSVPEDDEKIMTFLYQNGPLSVLINADLLQYYITGVWDPPKWMCDPTELDHAVLLVGWGEEKDLIGKVTKYWIVKNSWGEKWGMHGYFHLKREDGAGPGVCGINTGVTTAVVSG